jgi:hypothetical protein
MPRACSWPPFPWAGGASFESLLAPAHVPTTQVDDCDAFAVRGDLLRARRVVHQNDHLVVLDTLVEDKADGGDGEEAEEEVVVRTLHFRARPALVQSAVLRRSGLRGLPPPGASPHGTHLQGVCNAKTARAVSLPLSSALPLSTARWIFF